MSVLIGFYVAMIVMLVVTSFVHPLYLSLTYKRAVSRAGLMREEDPQE